MAMDWELIGDAVRQRREALGLTQKEAARNGEMSEPVWNALENARQDAFAKRTITKVCRALQWPLDAIDQIGAGVSPSEIKDAHYGLGPIGFVPESDDARLDRIEAMLLNQQALIESLVQELQSDRDDR